MKKKLTKKQWMRRRRIARFFRISLLTIVTLILILFALKLFKRWNEHRLGNYSDEEMILNDITLQNDETINVDLLPKNSYSRPGKKLKKINAIVIHYVGNPSTTAKNNRDYFAGLATSQKTKASSHFVVGLEGEIIQCVPLNEISYCSNHRNKDTIAIEVCHLDETGKFNDRTYESVVELTAYLCQMFHLDEEDVIRHYDVTGKKCPLYYVDHEDAWEQLKVDVKKRLKEMKQNK